MGREIDVLNGVYTVQSGSNQKTIIDACVYVMCVLHARQWDFENGDAAANWLMDLIVDQKVNDSRRKPGPTQTIRALAVQSISMNIQGVRLKAPRLMARTLLARVDVVEHALKEVEIGRGQLEDNLSVWFYTAGVHELGILPYIKDEIGSMLQPYENNLPILSSMLWRVRPDLQKAFDLSNNEGREGMLNWFLTHGKEEYYGIKAMFSEFLSSKAGTLVC